MLISNSFNLITCYFSFPDQQTVKCLPTMRKPGFNPGWEDLERGNGTPYYSCLENPWARRNLVGYSPMGLPKRNPSTD